jgi:hypothetical protein
LTERPACFEIVPTALAVRQAPAQRRRHIIVVATQPLRAASRPMSAMAPGVRELRPALAEHKPGAISSSRCQTTRILRRQRHAKPCLLPDEPPSSAIDPRVPRSQPFGIGHRHAVDTTRIPATPHTNLVEPDGIEPTTSCLQSRRSPS